MQGVQVRGRLSFGGKLVGFRSDQLDLSVFN
jgi:hypothetical protein